MGYIRISKENCFCLYEHEPVDDRKLKDFFRVGQVVLVKDKLERVIGIISFSDFKKAKENGKYPINRTFKKITLHTGYMEEVRKFFDETNYQSIPVLTEEGELIESFIRAGMTYNVEMDGGKWIDIANSHLAELVRKKGYRRIKICITDSQSDEIYSYFKHYESLYDTVEKILWYDIWKAKEADIIITNGKMNRDLHVTVYSFHSLRIELEYHLLLQNCIKNKINLYLISTPTADNVWNTTGEEKRRISKGKHWIEYLKNKESNSELLEQVLDRKDEIDQFIDSCMNLPPVVVKNQLCYEREHISAYVNVINGNRLTEGIPDGAEKHIYLSGNSFVFGPLVDDRHTVASILQAMAKRTSELKDYKVVNEGMRGIPFYESLKRLNHDQFFAGGGDIVVLFVNLKELFFELEEDAKKSILDEIKIYHLEDVFNALDRTKVTSYFIESPTHPNEFGYQLTAEYLMRVFKENCDDVWKRNFTWDHKPVCENEAMLHENREEWIQYIELLKRYQWEGSGTKGAIVMNCNPLTYGHQHLIEYAAKKVDYLYLFVVQEDKSTYSFEERYEMVRACAERYSNIAVLPSGRFIISAMTFPEYFTKEMEKPETVIDTSNDVMIFGTYIAPILNITVRFAGEEPTDFVTAQYNASMKQMLPEYGIQFEEIPRYAKEGIGVISGTKVRESIKRGEWARVRELVPETTYQIIEKRDKRKWADTSI